MNLITFTWVLVGFCALCMGTRRHANRLSLSHPLNNPPAFCLTGWTCLLISVVFSIAVNGPAIGTVLWFGLASAAAAVVMLALTYIPGWLPKGGAVAGLVAVCGGAAACFL